MSFLTLQLTKVLGEYLTIAHSKTVLKEKRESLRLGKNIGNSLLIGASFLAEGLSSHRTQRLTTGLHLLPQKNVKRESFADHAALVGLLLYLFTIKVLLYIQNQKAVSR